MELFDVLKARAGIPVDDPMAVLFARLTRKPKERIEYGHYGFKVDKNDPDPSTRVTYLYDAVGKEKAFMDSSSEHMEDWAFQYGGWKNVWFVALNKPVALKFDGTVDYELDPEDYDKKLDGTASDVSDTSYNGNFMASIPLCWVKRWEDENYRYFAVSPTQIDSSYKAYAHTNAAGVVNDVFYAPMFKGSMDTNSKLRSVSGADPLISTGGSAELTAIENCGAGWQMWDWAKHELIADLLTLISGSTNVQNTFGTGNIAASVIRKTGTNGERYGKTGAGQFTGKTAAAGGTHNSLHVKVFHIEDFWGNRWERCLGLHCSSSQYVYKMTAPYLLTPDSTYTQSGLTAPSSNMISELYTGDFGSFPKATVSNGNYNTYECDGFTKGGNAAVFGGFKEPNSATLGFADGSRCLSFGFNIASTYNSVGASVCYNQPSAEQA